MWWSRYTLVLAAVAVRRPGAGRHRAVVERGGGTALFGATVLLVGFTTFSALAPSHERTLAADGTTLVVSLPDLASTVVAGDGDEHLMPWIGARGMRKIPSGTTIAYVEALPPQYPQVLAGIDLDHPLVHLRRPTTPKALAGALKASGADYLYLPEPLAPGGVEAVAVSDRLHWRRVDTGGPVHGGAPVGAGHVRRVPRRRDHGHGRRPVHHRHGRRSLRPARRGGPGAVARRPRRGQRLEGRSADQHGHPHRRARPVPVRHRAHAPRPGPALLRPLHRPRRPRPLPAHQRLDRGQPHALSGRRGGPQPGQPAVPVGGDRPSSRRHRRAARAAAE